MIRDKLPERHANSNNMRASIFIIELFLLRVSAALQHREHREKRVRENRTNKTYTHTIILVNIHLNNRLYQKLRLIKDIFQIRYMYAHNARFRQIYLA